MNILSELVTQSSEPKRPNSCTSFPLKMNLEKDKQMYIFKEYSESMGLLALSAEQSLSF